MSYSTKLEEIEAEVIASLRHARPNDGPISFSLLIEGALRRKCISYRRHGEHGELRKPMHHLFEVKGGHSNMEAMLENLSTANAFFKRLSKR